MLLADRFEVPKVMAAVGAAFSLIPAEQLEWQTVLQLLQLPPSCHQQRDFQHMFRLAMKRLQEQLGDLEEVWADTELQQQLLALPFHVLQQLLTHIGTRVATENTVVYTVERWYTAHAEQQVDQLRRLMHLVRAQYCSAFYAGTVMLQSSLVQQCFKVSELGLLQTCCMPGGYAALDAAKAPVLLAYPAWKAKQRPASAKQPVLVWLLPLGALQAAAEPLLNGQVAALEPLVSTDYILQGQLMRLAVEVTETAATGTTSSGGTASSCNCVQIGAFLRIAGLPPSAVRIVSARITCLTSSMAPSAVTHALDRRHPFSSCTGSWGCADVFKLGQVSSWVGVEAALQQKHLVHAPAAARDGVNGPYLHIQVDVTELL